MPQGPYGVGANSPDSLSPITVGDDQSYPSISVDKSGRVVAVKSVPLTPAPQGVPYGLPSGAPGVPSPGVTLLSGTANQVNVSAKTGSVTLSTPQNIDTGATPQFLRLGLNQAADASARMAATGQYFSTKFTCTVTLDWNNGNVQYIVLANGAQTFTFANPKDGARYVIILKQPSSGAAGTVTWPGTILWAGGSAPTLTATNNKVDVVTFVYDATNTKYYGLSALNF